MARISIRELPVTTLTKDDPVIGVVVNQHAQVKKVEITGSFRVDLVRQDSDHPMAERLCDEEGLYVYSEREDRYYPADEFFFMTDINRFISL